MATGAQPGEAGGVAGAAAERGVTEPTAADRARARAWCERFDRFDEFTTLPFSEEDCQSSLGVTEHDVAALIAEVRAEAVAHERERAARAALDKRQAVHGQSPWDLACLAVAAAIRAGEGA